MRLPGLHELDNGKGLRPLLRLLLLYGATAGLLALLEGCIGLIAFYLRNPSRVAEFAALPVILVAIAVPVGGSFGLVLHLMFFWRRMTAMLFFEVAIPSFVIASLLCVWACEYDPFGVGLVALVSPAIVLVIALAVWSALRIQQHRLHHA